MEEKNDQFYDIRSVRPSAIVDKKTGKEYNFVKAENFELNHKRFHFTAPNNISLFVSIAYKQRNSANKLYKEFIKKKINKSNYIEFKNKDLEQLYDYFEQIQTSIITIYTAVEALGNLSIPSNYILEKKNTKGVKELWDKVSIERWITTSEKIGEILPTILKIESPKKLKLWTDFKKLEQIRNDIIHPKSEKDETQVDNHILKFFLKEDIFRIIDAGFNIIKFFCVRDKSNHFFPFGFSDYEIKKTEVDDFSKYFVPFDSETGAEL